MNSKKNASLIMSENDFSVKHAQLQQQPMKMNGVNDANSNNFTTNALSAAGAAFLSAVIVNPLDVAKTRLQAQAAGAQYAHPLSNALSRMAFFGPTMMFADLRCSPTCTRAGIQGTEGVTRLWRGTNAGLALAIPMVGIYLPFYDVFRTHMEDFTSENSPSMKPYVPLVAGALARSLACTTCYPIELARTRMQCKIFAFFGLVWEPSLLVMFPIQLYVGRPSNPDGGMRGLFAGAGPRVARAGPSVGIVVSFYEVVKYVLHTRFSS